MWSAFSTRMIEIFCLPTGSQVVCSELYKGAARSDFKKQAF